MRGARLHQTDRRSLIVLRRRIEVCERFEAGFQRGPGRPIEDYLAELPEDERPSLLRELVALEAELRQERGQSASLSDYLERFPQHADLVMAALGTVAGCTKTPVKDMTAQSSAEPSIPPVSPFTTYQLLGELGRGGMGIVYRALDHRRRETVALKTLKRVDPELFYRFKREFRTLADLSHPNLVTVHEFISDGREWYLAMELVEGVSFIQFVRSGGRTDPARSTEPMDPAETSRQETLSTTETSMDSGAVASLAKPHTDVADTGCLNGAQYSRLRKALAQLSSGVMALHKAGILHRDLKPSNVLVTQTGRVVILDFGLAAELGPKGSHESSEPKALGTVAYMAPEQAAGSAVGPAADWYSIGIMLYEALTGRVPFRGRPLEVLMNKQSIDPPAPRDILPEVPKDLDALCVDMLRRDPEERPTGTEIISRLGGHQSGDDAPASQPHRGFLVGRDYHLATLAASAESVRTGRTTTVFVHGQSGAGKTALLQDFLASVRRQSNTVVFAGRCFERESVPYKAIDGLVDELSRHLRRLSTAEARTLLPRDIQLLAGLFPALNRADAVATAPRRRVEITDSKELRRRAFAALRELLARIGDRALLVLCIDDLQWGDAESGALLSELLRTPEPPCLLLLVCYRSEDSAISPILRQLLNREACDPAVNRVEIAVEPLTQVDSERLVHVQLGAVRQALARLAPVIARESGGNPFFISELVGAVKSGTRDASEWLASGRVALDDVLASRVQCLPDGARRLLEVISVSGRPLQRSVAYHAAGCDAEAFSAVAMLRSCRLVRSSAPAEGDALEPYHDRVRQMVVSRLSPELLQIHHRRLALALRECNQADPEQLAAHYLAAGEREQAGNYSRIAADDAARVLAFERAAKLYRQALELTRRTARGQDSCVPVWRRRWRMPVVVPKPPGNTWRPPTRRTQRWRWSSGAARPTSTASAATSTRDVRPLERYSNK